MFRRLLTGAAVAAVALGAAALPAVVRSMHGSSVQQPRAIEHTRAAERHHTFAPTHERGISPAYRLNDADAATPSATAAHAAAPRLVLGDGTTLYGSMLYANSWVEQGAKFGLYSFTASATPDFALQHAYTGGYRANGGGTYADGKYYYNSFVYTPEMGYTFSTFITLDIATGQTSKVTHSFIDGTFDQSQITHDMAYDPTTGQIFAIAYIKVVEAEGLIERFRPAIATVDTYTGFVTPIAQTPGLIAIAVNNAGELYGITKGAESTLYRINKVSGECTPVGPTGLNPEYVQSATFDPVTDRLYWAETQLDGTTGLYQVDVNTGAADRICAFADGQELTGLYIPAPQVAAAAPAAVSGQRALFQADTLSGQLQFTAPVQTYGGGELSGALTAEITLDGQPYQTLAVQPGQTVSVDATVTEGIHGYSVSVSNAAGRGPRTGASWYAGIDGPAAVGNLQLAANADAQPVLSWTAPATGRNGGYIDPARLTYTVVRMPDGKTVADGIIATTFTDRDQFDAQQIWYTVTAACAGRQGVESSTATGLYGRGSELPVTFGFDSKADFDLCTVVDANGDFDAQYNWGGWLYSTNFKYADVTDPCVLYAYHPENAADDWIFMPPFTAKAGQKYRVSFELWTRGNNERISVTAGPTASPATQQVIMAEKTLNHKDRRTYTAEYTATADGNNYIGFRCTSAKKMFYLYIDNVTIDEVPLTTAPAAVTGLGIIPGEQGALEATIVCCAPAIDAGGAALTALTAVDIFRGNDREAIHSFTGIKPGQTLMWKDSAPVQGFNTYRVVARNATGSGEKAVATAYIGHDLPKAATDVVLTTGADGQPTLTWTAPTEGQNGGYVDSSNLLYRITRSDNVLVASAQRGCEFVDRSLDGSQHQYFIYYQVEPVSPAGVGEYALSNHLTYGEPYAGEFFESFADAALGTDPWTLFRIKGRQQLWTIASQGSQPACPPADRDGGLAVFVSTNGSMGDEGRLVSPKLKISDMMVPVLSFAFYHNPDEGTLNGDEPFQDALVPELLLPDGSYVPLDDPIMVDDPRYQAGWYLYVYRLTDYKQYGHVQLSFHAYGGAQNDIHLDYISLESNVEDDLLAYSFTGPQAVKSGKTARYNFSVFNQGMNPAAAYTVRLLRDGEPYMSIDEAQPLGSGKTRSYEFNVPTTLADEGKTYAFSAAVEYDADSDPTNDQSQVINTAVLSPDVPQVRSLKAEDGGSGRVQLSWGAADALHVQDSFEDYAAFTIDKVGDYTLVDADKALTFTFQQIDYPNAGTPMAYMVFNPYTLGMAPMLQEWAPHSGRQLMAAFGACDNTGKGIVSNDWLITPQLIPGSEMSLWVKTANYEFGLEEYEIMYSSTNTDPTAFKPLVASAQAAAEWTQVKFTVPMDAKYVAVHYKTNDGFVFYLDDMAYVARHSLDGAELSGFRVYRDGVAVADLSADRYDCTLQAPDAEAHTYGVTALFGQRESRPVETILGVGNVGLDQVQQGLKLSVANGQLTVSGTQGRPVQVCDASGLTLFSQSGRDAYTVTLTPGVYIVKCGTEIRKTIIK